MGLQRVGRDRVPFTFALVTAHKLQKLAGEPKEAQSSLRTDGTSDPMRVQGGRLGSTLRPGFLVCTGSERPKSQSCPALCDPWTAARQAPLSTAFSKKNAGAGCHVLLQGSFPTQGSKHVSCIGL